MPNPFCSITSIRHSENLFGTAPHFRRLLLIEYAKPWGAKYLEDSKLEPHLIEYLKKGIFKREFDKVLWIKNDFSASERIRLFLVHNREDQPVVQYHQISDYKSLPEIDFKTKEGILFKEPLYLVCTNGKKDKCCAKFGLPFYNGLKKLNPNVWQCAHIGGDRFAPNVFTLPYCHFYGHLSLQEIPDFYETTLNKKIYISRYRGRSCYSFKAQAAEYFLRKKLKDYSFDHLKLLERDSISKQKETFHFLEKNNHQEYAVTLHSEKSNEKYLLTCKSPKASFLNIFSLISILKV